MSYLLFLCLILPWSLNTWLEIWLSSRSTGCRKCINDNNSIKLLSIVRDVMMAINDSKASLICCSVSCWYHFGTEEQEVDSNNASALAGTLIWNSNLTYSVKYSIWLHRIYSNGAESDQQFHFQFCIHRVDCLKNHSGVVLSHFNELSRSIILQ